MDQSRKTALEILPQLFVNGFRKIRHNVTISLQRNLVILSDRDNLLSFGYVIDGNIYSTI